MRRAAPTPATHSLPGFKTWMTVIALALIVYFRFATALFLALTFAVVCHPLYDHLCRMLTHPRFPDRRRPGLRRLFARPAYVERRHLVSQVIASVTTQLIAYAFVLVCVLAPVWILSQNRVVILKAAGGAYAQAQEWSRGRIQTLGKHLHIQEWRDFRSLPKSGDVAPPPASTSFDDQTMQDKVVEMVTRPAPFLSSALKTVGDGSMLLGQVMFFFMALHFMLLRGPALWQDILGRTPAPWRPTLAVLSRRLRTVLMATCVVHGLTAVSAFLVALPVFWIIVGSDHFLLLAMLAGLFQFIPLIGSATLVFCMTLYFFATGSVWQGWECLLLAFPLVVGLPDLGVRPFLSERYGKIHSMTMLAGFVTGFEIFGWLGFVLGPLLLDLIVQFSKQVLYPAEAETDLGGVKLRPARVRS